MTPAALSDAMLAVISTATSSSELKSALFAAVQKAQNKFAKDEKTKTELRAQEPPGSEIRRVGAWQLLHAIARSAASCAAGGPDGADAAAEDVD